MTESAGPQLRIGDLITVSEATVKVDVDGKPNAFGVRFTDVYALRHGKWQMVTWQSTKLPA